MFSNKLLEGWKPTGAAYSYTEGSTRYLPPALPKGSSTWLLSPCWQDPVDRWAPVPRADPGSWRR